jgi:hypothetical protein
MAVKIGDIYGGIELEVFGWRFGMLLLVMLVGDHQLATLENMKPMVDRIPNVQKAKKKKKKKKKDNKDIISESLDGPTKVFDCDPQVAASVEIAYQAGPQTDSFVQLPMLYIPLKG